MLIRNPMSGYGMSHSEYGEALNNAETLMELGVEYIAKLEEVADVDEFDNVIPSKGIDLVLRKLEDV